jgi:RHS repeat-associated protein
MNLLDRAGVGGSTYTQPYASTVTPPYWVKLARSGNTFTGYLSPDGVSWTQIGSSRTIMMIQDIYVGLAVSGDSNVSLSTATFDNVTLSFSAPLNSPVVSNVLPTKGPAGTSVTISGANFGASQGSSTIRFGSTAASVISWSDARIVAVVSAGTMSGAQPAMVVVNSVSSNSDYSFTVVNLTISSITPPAAPIGGIVTLTGTGFGSRDENSRVFFSGVVASTGIWNDTNIQAVVPAVTSGPVTVFVGGFLSNSVQFTVLEALSISGISPATGTAGSAVTITGAGFGATQSTSAVSFNGQAAASVTNWSDTRIVAIVPLGASTGPVRVTVAGITVTGPTLVVNAIAQTTDSLGYQSSYTSTTFGGQWYVTSSQGPGCTSCTVGGNMTYQYDTWGNVLSATDALGRTTSYTYDSGSNVTSVTQPAVGGTNPTWYYTYNSLGEVLTMTDPLGNVTTNAYDAHGNLTSVTSPSPDATTAGSVTRFTYDSLGQLTQITDPLGRVTAVAYTPAGLIASITDAQQHVTSYEYDARGNRTRVTDALQNQTNFAYDSGDRLLTITYPGGSTTTFTYDYRGRRTSVTDQNGKKTSYAYDDADRLTSVTDAANNVTQYAYDTENNLVGITDANNHTTTFAYDAYRRVTKTTFPSNLYETYAYDPVGNLVGKTDRKGQTITYLYDALDRLTQKTYPDMTHVDYLYDLVGRIQQVNDPTGTYGFAYDNMGRLIGTSTQYSFVAGGPYINAYTYDTASNRTGFTAPDGSTSTYGYDTLNRLGTLANSWAGTFGFSYDELSRRTQMTRPNGVNTNYSYDNLSRLLSVLHQVGGATIDGASYVVDAAGNRTSKTDRYTGVTSSYGYDAIYQLLQVQQGGSTTESYTYDAVGNRLSSLGVSVYQYNSSNELTSTPNALYAYDNNGNTTLKADATGSTTYAWDYENRLKSMTMPAMGGTVSFRYDPLGRRIQQSGANGTTNFVYDGYNLIQENDNDGNLLAKYTDSDSVDEPLAMHRGGTSAYYQADATGSISTLSDSTGVPTRTYTYDSFGKTIGSTGTLSNPFQFAGRELDSETRLNYLRARYYDPQTGRFLSEDPIGLVGGINMYSYVRNDPVNQTDPSGKGAEIVLPQPWLVGFRIPVVGQVALAGVAGWMIGREIGHIPIGDGRTVDDAVTDAMASAWLWFGRRGRSDPYSLPLPVNPGREPCDKGPGRCKPCPPPSLAWVHMKDAHGSTVGYHYHQIVWDQDPATCTCYPKRISGGF